MEEITKQEYDDHHEEHSEGLFAIRSGSHSSIPGASNVAGGVLIDLSAFAEVSIVETRSSVVLGTGARWLDVSTLLDKEGLAVVGGRDSAVGVGGLTLGGGLPFFSSQNGLVCSNILSNDIVLASREITTATPTHNRSLWRAFKGGSNNFGIVTRFTARCFASTKIWSGAL